jgi:ABC-type tungstate transport system substrate-binding protein
MPICAHFSSILHVLFFESTSWKQWLKFEISVTLFVKEIRVLIMGDDELSQICINPLFVWQGSRMLSAICQAWNCSKSQPTRAKFRFKLVRRQLYSVHLCAWLLCHGRCPPGPESRLWTLRGYQIRKVWLYEPVCINWFHQTTRKVIDLECRKRNQVVMRYLHKGAKHVWN